MNNKSPTKSKTTLPELKTTRDKSPDFKLQKSNVTLLQPHKQLKSERRLLKMNYSDEHDIKPDSESKTLIEDEKTKRHSKLRTSKLLPATEKTILMEKFESSLKERLLNSAHFSNQIPLFDENITIDRIRNKSPRDKLDSNESMYNSVFPARKESGKNPPKTNDLFSKHNKESIEWLQEINSHTFEPVSKTESNLMKIEKLSKSLLIKKGENLRRIRRKEQNFSASEVSKYLSEEDNSRNKQDKAVKSADSSLSSQVSKKKSSFKLAPLKNRKDTKSSRSLELQEIGEDDKEAIKTLEPQVQHFGEGEITPIQKCPNKIERTCADSLILDRQLISENKKSETLTKTFESPDQSIRVGKGDETGSSQLKVYNINKNDLEKPSNNDLNNYLSQNPSIDMDNSPDSSSKLESDDSIPVNEYQVLYFQVANESQDTVKVAQDNAEKDDASYEKPEMNEDETKEEDNNEPEWFADYGVDKKSRQGMDLLSEKSSDEDEFVLAPVPEEAPVIQVQPEEVKEPKKKVKKTIHKIVEPVIETVIEESEIFVSETVREIKTVPLITYDEVPPIKEEEVAEIETIEMPLEYLKKNVGQSLTAGLAQVALFMPRDPVEYLAHWLISERHKEELIENLKQFKSEVRKVRHENIKKIRQNTQMEYLQNEILEKYNEYGEPQYPKFDSSESESTNVSMHEAINYVH